jgi:hypothetical protein
VVIGNAPASWSAVALHRFSTAHQTCTQFQTPFAAALEFKKTAGTGNIPAVLF